MSRFLFDALFNTYQGLDLLSETHFNDNLSGVTTFNSYCHNCEVVILFTLAIDIVMDEKMIPHFGKRILLLKFLGR